MQLRPMQQGPAHLQQPVAAARRRSVQSGLCAPGQACAGLTGRGAPEQLPQRGAISWASLAWECCIVTCISLWAWCRPVMPPCTGGARAGLTGQHHVQPLRQTAATGRVHGYAWKDLACLPMQLTNCCCLAGMPMHKIQAVCHHLELLLAATGGCLGCTGLRALLGRAKAMAKQWQNKQNLGATAAIFLGLNGHSAACSCCFRGRRLGRPGHVWPGMHRPDRATGQA